MSDCIFCKIVDGVIPSKKIYEDEDFLAFHDISPRAKVHALVIPKKHVPTYMDLTDEDTQLMGKLHKAVQATAKELGVDQTGFRLINNSREDSGQDVYHIHFHILGGQKLPFEDHVKRK